MPRARRAMGALPNFPSVNGAALVAGAWAVEISEIFAAFTGISDQYTASNLIEAMRAYVADPIPTITVIDPFGYFYSSVIVKSIEAFPSQLADGTWRVDSHWQFQTQASLPGAQL